MITDIMSFEDAVTSASTDCDLKAILYEKEPKVKFKDLVASQSEPTQTVLVSGPEGGLAGEEIRLA
jgi:16S rRNA U1498 N3-methylase RsmE